MPLEAAGRVRPVYFSVGGEQPSVQTYNYGGAQTFLSPPIPRSRLDCVNQMIRKKSVSIVNPARSLSTALSPRWLHLNREEGESCSPSLFFYIGEGVLVKVTTAGLQ